MKILSPSGVIGVVLALVLTVFTSQARATVVQFETVFGDFQVLLYEETTPQTVANFLAYVEAGDYNDSFIHRAVSNFIVQGGGYRYDYVDEKLVAIPLLPPIINEPVHSNIRGTIAMAKLGNDPHSAQAQWFINLADNAFLDDSTGGFTVFGEVLEDGMDVIDEIMNVSRFTHTVDGFTFSDWPLRNYTRANRNAGVPVGEDQLVLIHSISVLYGVDEEEPPAEDDKPAEQPVTETDDEPPTNDETTEEPAPEPEEESPGDDLAEEPTPAPEDDGQENEEAEPVEDSNEADETPEDTTTGQQPPPANPPTSQPASSGGGAFNLWLLLLLGLAVTRARRRAIKASPRR